LSPFASAHNFRFYLRVGPVQVFRYLCVCCYRLDILGFDSYKVFSSCGWSGKICESGTSSEQLLWSI
jgi:hypothetical protein